MENRRRINIGGLDQKQLRKLILKTSLSPGDVIMLTAAVRDLHRCYPDQFLTAVRTPCPQLWENNPYVSDLDESTDDALPIECHYPLVHRSNSAPYHFIHGYIAFLNSYLGLNITPTFFGGDIHLSAFERSQCSQVHEIIDTDAPFWIVVSGGKRDFTAKWWHSNRYQQVVDHFEDRLLFVQVGEASHYHPPLKRVLDLRGKTDLRQLVRLVYHSQGVLCPVTSLMHLAAAIEYKYSSEASRPCVVVAGGREPTQWEAYPHHQYLHTIGALQCCSHGGCWKSRAFPLGDGDEKDQPQHLCINRVGMFPRCMDLITADDVIRRIQIYFHSPYMRELTGDETRKVKPHLTRETV